MKTNDATKHADELFIKAQSLIKTFSLAPLAKKYFSDVEVVGAARTNLMWDPDIDFDCVVKKFNHESILAFVNDLFSSLPCTKVFLYNHGGENVPYFIVNVEDFAYEGENWIITFFVIEGKSHSREYTRWVLNNLNESKRRLILRIKQKRKNLEREKTFPSKEIYDAVLTGKVRQIEDFSYGGDISS